MSAAESSTAREVARVDNPFGNAPIVAAPGASAMALIQRESREIEAAMVIAQRFPRNERKALDRILTNCQRIGLAEEAQYEYSRGGTAITGPSIRLAEELMRSWGNIWAGVTELSRANGVSEVQTYAWDLETGSRDEKKFQVRLWRDTRGGGYALTEERDIYEFVANNGARRKRACILAVIPSDVVDAAVKQCEETLKAKAEVTPERLRSLLEKFATYNVTKEMIEKRLQRKLESMQPAQMLGLGRIFNSLKDGMSAPNEWFEMPETTVTTPAADAPKTQTDAAKDALRAKQATGSGDKKEAPNAPDPKASIEKLRECKTLKDLDEAYGVIVKQYVDASAGVPVEIEGAYGDRKVHIQQQSERK